MKVADIHLRRGDEIVVDGCGNGGQARPVGVRTPEIKPNHLVFSARFCCRKFLWKLSASSM
ncbi:hypothetical protein O6R08_01235 [Cutibacterium equinum]|uniref:Uncharacterized protein n=1 Tax=Cutibacterium equinum TaxID=3016342 RepID=A0ABY7QYY8_9ACTN|nr:hypothetical protein [Cutibacterium equinum]WCC80206.1 hypothetical protein O6R08_01235 [Cutibacterium equinum]